MNTQITVKDIIDITKGKLIYGDENEICENFSRNTKEINQDDIFVGFKGDKFDGGKFYEDALKAGAKGCIINKIDLLPYVDSDVARLKDNALKINIK